MFETSPSARSFLACHSLRLQTLSMPPPARDSDSHDLKNLLDMPPHVREALLPIPDSGVLDFLKFALPVVTKANCSKLSASDFFSRQPVNYNTPAQIQKIPIPPASTVQTLRSALPAILRTGQNSVVYAHITSTAPRYFPLWTILYWSEVVSLRQIRDAWSAADESLGQQLKVWKKAKGQQVDHTLVQSVYDTLSVLPWSGTIHGFSNNEPLHIVATYASPKAWFSDAHQHQMLDILRRTFVFIPVARRLRLKI